MKFAQAAPTETYFERWVSENGLWELGFRKMMFGVRVSANPVRWDTAAMDYCAGPHEQDRLWLFRLTRTILEGQPETLTGRELRAMLPGWEWRPVVTDEACMAGLMRLALAAMQRTDVAGAA